jgi:hypothetical protein
MTSNIDPEKLARLPIWARHEIQRLEGNLASAEAEVSALKGVPVEHDPRPVIAWADPYSSEPRPVARDRDIIRFYPSRVDTRSYVDLRWKSEFGGTSAHLEIRSSECMILQPWSSNVVRLFLTDASGQVEISS